MSDILSSSVWSLAGHDPFAGAGLQADMRVAASLSQTLRTLMISFTAQNDKQVLAAEPTSSDWLDKQWRALATAETPAAYKIGLILSHETVRWLADHLRPEIPLILDPVLGSSSGTSFVPQDLLASMREYLFHQVDVLTPNRPEAERIAGIAIKNLEDVKKAASIILSQGVKAVLIKGGHRYHEQDEDTLVDYFDDGVKPFLLKAKRVAGEFRGTGCALSSAIACFLAQGLEPRDAIVAAHSYVQAAIAAASSSQSRHLPSIRATAPLSDLSYGESGSTAEFKPLKRSLGFYPVLSNVDWIARFARSGVKTVQLRIKDRDGEELRASIQRAKKICEENDIALFINDAWQLAIESGVYGVHLGQEDLDLLSLDDLERIRSAGLRLGLSTHSLEEAARAKALKPSYIALGPVFETTCKSMRFGPQGISRVGEWVRRLPGIPIVAIGGLNLSHASSVLAEGADSIAVITDLIRDPDPEQRMNVWLKAFPA